MPKLPDTFNCRCPNCSASLNAAAATDGTDVVPEDGDATICIYCGALLMFQFPEDRQAGFVPLSVTRWEALPAETQQQMLFAQARVKAMARRAVLEAMAQRPQLVH